MVRCFWVCEIIYLLLFNLSTVGLQMGIMIEKTRIWSVIMCFLGCFLFGCHSKQEEALAIKKCKELEKIILSPIRKDTTEMLKASSYLLTNFPNSPQAQIFGNLGIAHYLERNGKSKEAFKKISEALIIAENESLKREIAYANLFLSDVFLDLNNLDSMTIALQKVEQIIKSKEVSDVEIRIKFYESKGLYFHEVQQRTEAIRMFKEMLELTRKEQLYYRQAQANFYISWMFSEQELYEEAVNYTNDAIALLSKYYPYEVADFYYEKAWMLVVQNKNEEAEEAILEAKRLFEKYGYYNTENQGLVANILGDTFRNRELYENAITEYKKAQKLLKKPINIKFLYNSLSKYYEQTGNFKDALMIQRKYEELKDSLFSTELALKSIDFENKYKLSLIEQGHHIEKQRNQIIITVIVIFSIIVVLIAILLIRFNSLKADLAQKKADYKSIEIELKERKLVTNTLFINQQNHLLNSIIQKLEQFQHSQSIPDIQRSLKDVVKFIKSNKQEVNEWESFKAHFEAVSPKFFEILKKKYPNLTELDLKHCAYIKINFTPKQVASLLGISPKSVTLFRVRLKKKMKLPEDVQLNDFLREI